MGNSSSPLLLLHGVCLGWLCLHHQPHSTARLCSAAHGTFLQQVTEQCTTTCGGNISGSALSLGYIILCCSGFSLHTQRFFYLVFCCPCKSLLLDFSQSEPVNTWQLQVYTTYTHRSCACRHTHTHTHSFVHSLLTALQVFFYC